MVTQHLWLIALRPEAAKSPLELATNSDLWSIDIQTFDASLYSFDILFDVPECRDILIANEHWTEVAEERKHSPGRQRVVKLFKIHDRVREIVMAEGNRAAQLMEHWAHHPDKAPFGRYTVEERAAMAPEFAERARRVFSQLVKELRYLLSDSANQGKSLYILMDWRDDTAETG